LFEPFLLIFRHFSLFASRKRLFELPDFFRGQLRRLLPHARKRAGRAARRICAAGFAGRALRVFGHAASKVSSIDEKSPTEGIEQNYYRHTLA